MKEEIRSPGSGGGRQTSLSVSTKQKPTSTLPRKEETERNEERNMGEVIY
jgi:hypothetical protein